MYTTCLHENNYQMTSLSVHSQQSHARLLPALSYQIYQLKSKRISLFGRQNLWQSKCFWHFCTNYLRIYHSIKLHHHHPIAEKWWSNGAITKALSALLGFPSGAIAQTQASGEWKAATQITKFMGPAWGPPGSCRPQMGPMLAPWTLLTGYWPLSVCSKSQPTTCSHK